MYLEVDNKKYEIVIEIKNNKNTYIRIKDDLKIHITTNRWTKEKDIQRLLTNNFNSIKKMLYRQIRKSERNSRNTILGKEIDIIVLSNQNEPELYGNKFYIRDNTKLDKYLKDYAFTVFEERLNYVYSIFEERVPYPKLKIRRMTTRWGVCNKKDVSITLNLELIRKDIKYIDYVILHELCHFKYFNHSDDFWNLVYKYNKEYKKLRKEMKE